MECGHIALTIAQISMMITIYDLDSCAQFCVALFGLFDCVNFLLFLYDLNRLFDCSYEHDLFDNNMDVFAAAMKAQSLQNQRPNMCINFRMPHYKIIF